MQPMSLIVIAPTPAATAARHLRLTLAGTSDFAAEKIGTHDLPLPTDARTTSVRLLSIIRCWHAVENTFLVELDESMGSAYYTAAKAFRAMLIDQGDDGLHAVRFWVQSLTDTLLHVDPYLSLAPFRPKLNS